MLVGRRRFMVALVGVTITRVRATPGDRDAYGDPVASTEAATEISGAFTAPHQSDEPNERGRDGLIIELDLYVPAGTDLTAADLIEVDGARYSIEGQPGVWTNPLTGWQAGVVAALKRAVG